MNKKQFLILNVLAVSFLLLTGLRLLLVKDIESHRRVLSQGQAVVAQGQQSEQVLRQLILRIAQASRSEPDLKDLLKQYNIQIGNQQGAAPTASPAPAPTPAPAAVPARPKTN